VKNQIAQPVNGMNEEMQPDPTLCPRAVAMEGAGIKKARVS
jgi:hypothetical protein